MNKMVVLASIALLLVSFSSIAQDKKLFTYEQLFKYSPPPTPGAAPVPGTGGILYKTLPVIKGWADDEHYIEMRKNDEGKMVPTSISVRTGKATPYLESKPEPFMPPAGNMDGARNMTTSPDGKLLAYTKKDNNLYIKELYSGKEITITADGSETILNGYASWVYYEEILGRGSRYKAFWWSPDSKKLCFMRFDDTQVPVYPVFVNEGQHGYTMNTRYPQVGDPNPEVKIGVYSVAGRATSWATFNEKEDQYFGTPSWTPDNQLLVQWMNRDQNTLIIYRIDDSNGKKEIYKEQQDTWIDLDDMERIIYLSSGKGFIIKSDKDGWENLYLYDAEGKLLNPITTGNFWGTSITKVDEKNKTIYFTARKENSARFDFYKAGLDGKNITRLSFGEFSHDKISLSPKGKYFITTYSSLSTPPRMALVDTKGKMLRMLGDSKCEDFDSYALPKTELTFVKSSDGLFNLPVTIVYPINFDPAKKYPVLVNIYGGPNAGTVYDRWRPVTGTPNSQGYSQWWAQEGMVQVMFDNRASGHFGKKGLNYIHRQLGIWEIEDYITCARYIRQQPWADTSAVAITGGSFGGYMTCMALTRGNGVFTHGIANASVTDWQYYDTHYTERFMDRPKDNPDGYKKTAVLSYADQYKGLLRIVHGTSDDNVHMQNSIVLINKLQELGKHFEFMLYPGEPHGIGYVDPKKGQHNRTEAAIFYYKNLLRKPVPAVFGGVSLKGF